MTEHVITPATALGCPVERLTVSELEAQLAEAKAALAKLLPMRIEQGIEDTRQHFRCDDCQAEICATAHPSLYGWTITSEGLRLIQLCPACKPTEPGSVEELQQKLILVELRLEEELMASGYQAQLYGKLEAYPPALREVIAEYEADESETRGENLYERVVAIESGDYWYTGEEY